MKFALGLYTQLSHNAPTPVMARALSCIFKPLLTYIHDNRECRLSIAQGSAMTSHLSWHFPEVNLLLSSLARSGSIELVTSAYNNTILPLVPHKDRSSAVDRTTTLIRKTYGVRATSLWCYGQVWAPSLIAMMKTVSLDRIVISSYDALTQKTSRASSFRMNELGRKIDVIQSDDRFSRLVSSYAQNEITLSELRFALVEHVRTCAREDDLVCMINMDQLCQGASYNREDDELLYTVFTDLLNVARDCGYTLSLMRDIQPSRVGYLPSGWYGRDAYAGSLGSFNDLFVRCEDYRYLLGRYLALGSFVDDSRKDRVLRKRLQDMLSTLPSGNLFLCDTHASCLSIAEHRQFFRTVIEAEAGLAEYGLRQLSADVDDDGIEEEFCYGKVNSALLSHVGGSVYEFSSRELGVNIFDTISPWQKTFPQQSRRRSFCDSYEVAGQTYDLSRCIYNLESVNRARNEFVFSFEDDGLPFSVSKHYRLSNQNLYMSHTLVNRSDEPVDVAYVTTVYFTLPDASAFAYDAHKEPLVGQSLSGIRNVRFNDSSRSIQLSFTSTDEFSVQEENRYQSEVTTLVSASMWHRRVPQAST